ncbi:MAG: hypothetical protein ACNYWM_08170 [Methanosarcinales archaeon]
MVTKRNYRTWTFTLLIIIIVYMTFCITLVHAKDGNAVQELSGRIETEDGVFYTLPDLKQGETLYVYAKGMSGNLDTFIGLSDCMLTHAGLSESFIAQVNQVMAEGRDPLVALPMIYNSLFTIWDDDSGVGYDATFAFVVPEDGEYQLLVARNPTTKSFGDFSLLVGLDAPGVLSGDAIPTGDEIAFPETPIQRVVRVQKITENLTLKNPETILILKPLKAGDTFYAFIEADSDDFAPTLVLRDYGGKPLRSAILSSTQTNATFYYLFEEDSSNCKLHITADGTEGDYCLLMGVNAPEVLTGDAEARGKPVLKDPIEVQIGVTLDQFNMDQKNEKFFAVAALRMNWHDPLLAFSPDSHHYDYKTFTNNEFDDYVAANEIIWPQFTFYNQQGNRWTQNRNVVVWPDGTALYFERFTTDFQAPLVDFSRFPFDTQHLFIRVNSLYHNQLFIFNETEKFSGIGDKLGEEEWDVIDSNISTSILDSRSSFNLNFLIHRHLTFYLFRIFIPILLIIIVSWFTFFLQDYGKRVDVCSANLLIFVAFNFTISGELPRLGYLTFMDSVLIVTFVMSAIAVAFNVVLKRLVVYGKQDLAERIDNYAIWIYPLIYCVGGVLVYLKFLV